MKTIGSLIFVFFLFLGVIYVLQEIGLEHVDNPTLDNDSKQFISTIDTKINDDYEVSEFAETENNISTNSSFEGADSFARQFLEDKFEINKKKNLIEKIKSLPDFLLLAVGFENDELTTKLKLLIAGLITLFIGLAFYVAIKTGDVHS